MAKTIGVDPGDAFVKVVEIDGSYRKTRLLAVHCEPVTDDQPKAVVVAAAVRNAIDGGMRGEVLLGHPCREAVLRTIDLPFKGREAIRKVVKAEVEGEIHGFAVDDMVVDFHEIGAGVDGTSRVLVAAVPKDGLRAQMAALQAASVEPQKIDLDTMALWRAAHWAGAFTRGEAVAGDDPSTLTAVIDVGSRSVKMLLVAGDRLVDMRALRLGEASACDDIANRHTLSPVAAREAMRACTETGSAYRIEVPEAMLVMPGADAPGADPAAEAAPAKMRSVVVKPQEVEAARAAFLQRLQRELFRYLASSGKGSVRALWVTGGACRMPGLQEVLVEVFGVKPVELDLLANLQHDLDAEQVAELGPQLAVAIGLALAPYGGPVGFDLRKEDLAFTRGFERIKFPLTIALMVGLLALFVYGNHQAALLNNLELQIGKTWTEKGKIDFFGMVNSVLVGKWWENPQNFLYEQSKGKDYKFTDLRDELVASLVHRRVQILRDKLRLVSEQKQKDSGIYEDVSLESGYAVLVRFSEVMKDLEPQLGRYLLTKLELQMKQNRYLKFTVAFRGPDFRERGGILEQAFLAEFQKPGSPFEKSSKSREDNFKEELFRNSGNKTEPAEPGMYYMVTLKVKESFDPFGRGATR